MIARVAARVAVNDDRGTSSSAGIAAATSASVAPQRRCDLRISGAVANRGDARMIFAETSQDLSFMGRHCRS
jgi:hypothetical protein